MVTQAPPQRLIESFYPSGELRTATPARRLGGAVLDTVFFILLAIFTLTIGWWIWVAIAARNGQSPGKQVLGMYVIREDGTRAGGWYTALRELVIEWLLFSVIISGITGGLGWVLSALWCLWDDERQCLWDKVAATYVAHSPNEYKPLTADELRRQGLEPPARSTPPMAPPPPATASSPGDTNAEERLRELRRLHDEGLITDEQFEERRARIVEEL